MKIITIKEHFDKRTSTIYIGTGILEQFEKLQKVEAFSSIFLITDKNIEKFLLKKILLHFSMKPSHIVLPAGEKEKNIETIQKIWKAMRQAGCDRKTLVLNIGGGVILDMGGFAASTYMRGTQFINIPTTLLAQVDASNGGKTAIDFDGIKNLIGTFNLPTSVFIDPRTLLTLPKREFVSGFAEIIKHGLIADKRHFLQATEKKPLQFSQNELLDIISKSCKIKAAIVQKDKTENSIRKMLNFGHTIGHAIESIRLETAHPLLHGEAISIGMVVEAKISEAFGKLSQRECKQIEQSLFEAGLPISLKNLDIPAILEKIKSDKKNDGRKNNFTLLQKIGEAIFNQNVSQKIIIEALRHVAK